MKDLIGTMSARIAAERAVRDYYHNFFSEFNSKSLFEIYDIKKETFVVFPGREGSRVVNRDTLVENLTDMEVNHASVDNIVVIPYDSDEITFNNPVFIGSADSYYGDRRGN